MRHPRYMKLLTTIALSLLATSCKEEASTTTSAAAGGAVDTRSNRTGHRTDAATCQASTRKARCHWNNRLDRGVRRVHRRLGNG